MTVATLGFGFAILMLLFYNTVKVLKEYERGVVFFLGRFQKVKGPGLILLFPIIQVMTKVDLRVIVMDVPTQDVISRDNVSVKVNAVIYFRIVDPGGQCLRSDESVVANHAAFGARPARARRHAGRT
jgi:regulator of protease activity HflC (stomatin/prohibitin superfamily)